MQIQFSIEPLYHAKDVESWLRVYVPGQPRSNTVCTGRASEMLEARLDIQDPQPGTTLCVW